MKKPLSKEDLSLLMTMGVFFCNITPNNFKSIHEELLSMEEEDFSSEKFNVWEPLDNHYGFNDLMDQIDYHQRYFLSLLETYETSNSK